MTKGVRLFLLLALGSLVSCVGGPKIKFDKLPSKEFVLTQVGMFPFVPETIGPVENFAIPSGYTDTVIPKLPFREIAARLEAEHGVRIDTSLFSEEAVSGNIKQNYVPRRHGLFPFYHVSFDTDETQTITFEFMRPVDRPDMNVTVTFMTKAGEKTTGRSSYRLSVPNWSPVEPVIADRNNAAVLRLGRLLYAQYVDNDPAVIYSQNNAAGERSFYIVPGVEHDIICRYRGGDTFIVDCLWQGKLEAGKRYVITKVMGFNYDVTVTEERP
jgi:hypothetical protein